MKPNRKNPLLAVFISLTLAAPSAFAVNLYWDSNGTTAGAGTAPTGTWGTDLFWNITATGSLTAPTNATTTSVDDLFFSAGTDATGSYNIALGASQTAKSLTFQDGTAAIDTVGGASTLTLAGGGGFTVDPTTTGATISSRLTLNGLNIFNVGSGSTLTVDGTTFTRGTRASLNVQGDGTVAAPVATGTLGTALSGATIAPWASIGTGTSTTYATISAGNVTGLGYTGGLDGTSVLDASGVTDTGGTLDYDVAAVGTLGAGASVNTLRYTGAAGNIDGDLASKGLMNAGSGLLTFTGVVTSGAAANEMVINTANAGITFGGTLTGSINKTGSGTMTLTNAVNRPSGNISAITVNQGILITNSANAPSASDAAMVGATINSGGTLRWGAGNRHDNGSVFTINAGGTLDINNQGDLIGGLSGAGSVITTGTPLLQLGNQTRTFSGVISGGLNLVKRGGGDQILSGVNTFTGTTSINNVGTTATLTLGNPLALQNSALNLNTASGTAGTTAGTATTGLRTTVTALTLGGLFGTQDLASVFRQDSTGGPGGTTALGGYSGVTALTLNPAAGVTRTYTAIIADGAAGMTLTKTGAGTQVISGVNSYTGATAVNGGTLLVDSPGSLAATSAVTVAAGATLGGNGTINGTVNAALGGLLAPGGAGTIGTLTLANDSASSLTLNGSTLLFDLPNTVTTGDLINITGASGGLTLNGANTIVLNAPSGLVPEGTYTLMTYSAQTGSGTLTFQNGTTTFGNASLTVGPTSVTLAVGPGGLDLGLNTWSGSVSGVWDGGILNWTRNGTVSSAYVEGDAVTFDDSGSNAATISSAAPVSPASVFFNNNSKNYTVSAVIAGNTTLAKTGSGTTTLTGSNTLTGATTISGGTLGTSGSGRLGASTYAAAMSIAPGATFNLAGVGQTLSGAITGGGTLRNSSGNDLILGNSGNSYGTLIMSNSGGRIFINNNAGALPAAATVAVTGGNLVFGFGTTRSNALSVSSGGILTARNPTTLTNATLPGSGTVIFNNDDANTRLLTINNGQTLTGALTVQIGGNRMGVATTVLGGVTMAGNLTGGGGLVVASSGNFANNPTLFGTGVLTLSGTNDYTGPTTVTAGTLAVTGSLGATAVTVSSPAILGGNGNIGGDVTIDSGATHSLAVAATPGAQVTRAITGTLTLNSGNLLNLTAAATPAAGEYVLATATTAITGTIDNANINFNGISGSVSVDTVSTPKRLLLTVTSSGFTAWIEGPFTNAIPVDKRGPNDDPDNDGISNLVEYAIAGQDPTVPNSTIGSFNGITLSYTKRLDATGLTYAIQDSTDLGLSDPWTAVTGTPPNYVNDGTTISYTLNPGTPAKNFIRLQVLSN